MFDYSNNKTSTIPIDNQRRKSSPDCLFPFKVASTPSILPQNTSAPKEKEAPKWLSRKKSFHSLFNVNNNHHKQDKKKQQQDLVKKSSNASISSSTSSSSSSANNSNSSASSISSGTSKKNNEFSSSGTSNNNVASPSHSHSSNVRTLTKASNPLLLSEKRFLLRSFSVDCYSPSFSSSSSNTTISSTPFFSSSPSSLSSSSSYFSSLSYTNSITLPAAPVLSGYSSLKKKKRTVRASITSSSSELFKQLYSQQYNSNNISSRSSSSNSISSNSKSSDSKSNSNSNTTTNELEESPKMMMMVSHSNSGVDEFASTLRQSGTSDIELATEIGQGLLSEVRRMQCLLQERQDSIQALEREKTDHQHRIDDLIKQLRFKNETEERLKEDIWNLELSKQDLNHQIRQISQAMAKAQLDQLKKARQASLLSQELDSLKSSQVNWQELMSKAQTSHEDRLSELTNSLVHLKKEKEQLRRQLQHLLAAKESLVSEQSSIEDLRRKQIAQAEELQKLQHSLLQAQEHAQTLQVDLDQEKLQRSQLDTLLRESQETIEILQREAPESATIDNADDESINVSHHLSHISASTTCSKKRSLHQELLYASSELDCSDASEGQQEDTSIHDQQQQEEEKPPVIRHHQPSGFEKVLPFVLHTMVGEWLTKHTRRKTKHARFFWLHPYTKTLYWSEQEPGVKTGEFKVKSCSIDAFHVEQGGKPAKFQQQQSIIAIRSSNRDIRIECIEKSSHEKWVQSLESLFKSDDEESGSSFIGCNNNRVSSFSEKSKRLSAILMENNPSTIRQKSAITLRNTGSGINKKISSMGFASLRIKS